MQQISWRFKLMVVLLWALPQMSTDIYLPSMPTMAKDFSTTIASIQYTIFFYTIGFCFGALVFGPVSDRIGRRTTIIISLSLAFFASILALFATSLDWLFFARFVQGFALMGISSTTRAMIKDVCADKVELAKFGAIVGIMLPLATAIAPVIGGYIEKYAHWRIGFLLILVYIVAFLIYSWRYLVETNKNLLDRPLKYVLIDYKEVLSNHQFLKYNLLSAFATCSGYAYITISPYLLQIKSGLSPAEFGKTNLLIAFTLILSSYVNSKMLRYKATDPLLKIGTLTLAIAGILYFIAGALDVTNAYTVIIPMVIMVAGSGFIYSNASAGALSMFNNNAGTAGAMYASIQMLGAAFGSGFITLVIKFGNPELFLGILLILQGIFGSILVNQLIRNNKI